MALGIGLIDSGIAVLVELPHFPLGSLQAHPSGACGPSPDRYHVPTLVQFYRTGLRYALMMMVLATQFCSVIPVHGITEQARDSRDSEDPANPSGSKS